MNSPNGNATVTAPAAPDRLVPVIQELSMARTLDAVQRIVRTAARQLVAADGATFVLRENDRCFYADEDAIGPLWKGKRFPMSACISGWAMLHRQVVVVEDIYLDPRVPVDAYRPTFVKSLAMIPIRSRDPIGAIGVYWARHHRADSRQVQWLQALADSASIAIENLALLADLRTAKDAAEAANRLKDEFLATISHELLTPLTPILSFAELLHDGSLDERGAREAIATIRSCAQAELHNVNALLDGSKMLAGTLTIRRSSIDPVPTVRAALDFATSEARSHGIDLRHELQADIGPVFVDGERLRQITWSLLSNAIKFTPGGGRITMSLARDGDRLRLVVADTGKGIVPEFVPQLFAPFRQQDGSMTRPAGGFGLGLALVHRLVQLHDGTIDVESAGLDRGTTFTVRLPIARQ